MMPRGLSVSVVRPRLRNSCDPPCFQWLGSGVGYSSTCRSPAGDEVRVKSKCREECNITPEHTTKRAEGVTSFGDGGQQVRSYYRYLYFLH